jgi:hypothetical protein
MKPSCESSLVELVFPDDPGPPRTPPQVSFEEMMRFTRQLEEWFPHGLPTLEERWKAKTEVPFELKD